MPIRIAPQTLCRLPHKTPAKEASLRAYAMELQAVASTRCFYRPFSATSKNGNLHYSLPPRHVKHAHHTPNLRNYETPFLPTPHLRNCEILFPLPHTFENRNKPLSQTVSHLLTNVGVRSLHPCGWAEKPCPYRLAKPDAKSHAKPVEAT